ncbi:MAG: hypothetical protein OEQ29_10855, partial [Alphaproteobacteria bacterium]|nr:hypothetical protein [Alphaproteobacteria bacterium]
LGAEGRNVGTPAPSLAQYGARHVASARDCKFSLDVTYDGPPPPPGFLDVACLQRSNDPALATEGGT